MNWTKDKPTVPGWYFKSKLQNRFGATRKSDNGVPSDIVLCDVTVSDGILAFRYGGQASSTRKPIAWTPSGALWCGPVLPPPLPVEEKP